MCDLICQTCDPVRFIMEMTRVERSTLLRDEEHVWVLWTGIKVYQVTPKEDLIVFLNHAQLGRANLTELLSAGL